MGIWFAVVLRLEISKNVIEIGQRHRVGIECIDGLRVSAVMGLAEFSEVLVRVEYRGHRHHGFGRRRSSSRCRWWWSWRWLRLRRCRRREGVAAAIDLDAKGIPEGIIRVILGERVAVIERKVVIERIVEGVVAEAALRGMARSRFAGFGWSWLLRRGRSRGINGRCALRVVLAVTVHELGCNITRKNMETERQWQNADDGVDIGYMVTNYKTNLPCSDGCYSHQVLNKV